MMKQGYKGYQLIAQEKIKAERERQLKRAEKNAAGRMTNESFAATNEEFKAACESAEIKPTGRQASKFRRHRGLAWEAHRALTNEKKAA
jgi:hypothetical protein